MPGQTFKAGRLPGDSTTRVEALGLGNRFGLVFSLLAASIPVSYRVAVARFLGFSSLGLGMNVTTIFSPDRRILLRPHPLFQ